MYWWVLSVNSIISDISIETWEEKLDPANCERKQSLGQGLRWKHQEASSSCRLHLSLMNIFWSGSLDKTDYYRVYISRDSTTFLTFSTRWSNSTKLFLIQKLPEAEETVNATFGPSNYQLLNQLTRRHLHPSIDFNQPTWPPKASWVLLSRGWRPSLLKVLPGMAGPHVIDVKHAVIKSPIFCRT